MEHASATIYTSVTKNVDIEFKPLKRNENLSVNVSSFEWNKVEVVGRCSLLVVLVRH